MTIIKQNINKYQNKKYNILIRPCKVREAGKLKKIDDLFAENPYWFLCKI